MPQCAPVYILRALTTNRGRGGWAQRAQTTRQRAHTVRHTVGHCQLYIQRAQTTSQTGAHWGTVYCTYRVAVATSWGGGGWAETNRHTGAHSGSYWGILLCQQPSNTYVRQAPTRAHLGTVYCIYRGHWKPANEGKAGYRGHYRQPDRQEAHTMGLTGAVYGVSSLATFK